jgi:plasmid replication initiation protein
MVRELLTLGERDLDVFEKYIYYSTAIRVASLLTESPKMIEEIQKKAVANAVMVRSKRVSGGLAPTALKDASLAPIRHPQQDIFLAQIFDAALKDDHASMEHPMFSLSKIPDLRIRVYEHKGNSITVTPSANGLATIWDKDILLFTISTLIEAQNRKVPISRTVRLRARDLLVYCNRGTSGAEYNALTKAFERLAGTRIKTDVTTGEKRVRQGFGLLESWSIVERTSSNRMASIELTLSEWLYNAVVATEVLTLSQDYFRLRKGLERRLYELARKHCGLQAKFAISFDALLKKSGAVCAIKEFRRQIREIVQANALPDYKITFDSESDQVVFWTRDGGKHLRQMIEEAHQRGITTLDELFA